MQLMTVQRFREQYFEAESRPSLNTLRKWIDEGEIRGKRIGNRYYIDEDGWQSSEVDNPLVARVLSAQS